MVGLGLFSGDDCASWDDSAHHPANCLNTEREWCDIDEKDIFGFVCGLASKDTALDCSTIGDSFIRIDTFIWVFSIEVFFEKLLYLWNTC